MSNKKAKSGGKRIALTALCVVLGLVLVVLLGGTIYVEYLMNQINYVNPGETISLSQDEIDAIQNGDETMDPDFTGPVLSGDEIDWGQVNVQIGGDNIVNILLIGQDRRPGEKIARSDSMILCTFNKAKNTLTMTSFMRDMYVQIPGYMDNRINASYSLGGMELLNETLYVNFGIEVDGNVEVDFDQFEYIIDLLGGVTLELTAAEASYINNGVGGSLTEGTQLLTGEQALIHARNRKVGRGDFARTSRQRQVLNALIGEYKNKSITTMLGLLDDILPMVTTDMDKNQITSYVTELFPLLANCTVITQQIPVEGGYYGASIREMSVLVPDIEMNRQALIDSLAE